MHSTLADCYILKYLLLNVVQNHPGLRGDFGQNIWFSKVILPQGFKMRLFVTYLGTRYKFLSQTVPVIIKPVDVRFNCSFCTKSGKLDHLEID